MIRQLCRVWKPEWQGMVMAELVYRPGKDGPLERTIQEGRLVRVMLSRGQEGEEMKISLLPRKGEPRSFPKERHGTYWRTFSAEEVEACSKALGDHNTIHQGKHPVVSGFQLLLALEKSIHGALRFRFHAPIYAGDPIYLEKEKGKWMAYTHQLCFVCEEIK